MGLIKWIKRELDSSNSCKRRQSEPPLPGDTEDQPRDESYVKALSKFNEWRRRQQVGGSVRLTRKQSKKLIERRGQSEQFIRKQLSNTNDTVAIQPLNNLKTLENTVYEEIHINIAKQSQNDLNTPPRKNNFYEKSPTNKLPLPLIEKSVDTQIKTNTSSHNTQFYENVVIELIDQCEGIPDTLDVIKNFLSPPVKFFKENSNPFPNARTPIRDNQPDTEDLTTNNNNHDEVDDWVYESPKNLNGLDALKAKFKQIEANTGNAKKSIPSDHRLIRNPPYQTVINKHGEEVEYALPLNEKFEDEVEEKFVENNSRILALNNTSSYQRYIEDNFQFLNENDRLGLSRVSESFCQSQFRTGNVLVTDLDGTSGTKAGEDRIEIKEDNILDEFKTLGINGHSISNNKERSIVQNSKFNMHFGEIIVCNSNEVSEDSPRQLFETLNGILHSGTFHCVPVTQFKLKNSVFTENLLQINYEVLRKIRHPGIALLMGITVDNKCDLDSLILEPLDYSLHHLIHEKGCCIPLPLSQLYAIQITNAVTYLHKHNLIHSNISTHTVLLCHCSKAVKLTSFELATTTNQDLKNELTQ